MPKHEIRHNAGKPASDKLKRLVLRYFSEKEVAKLERLGGRVLISLTSPYNPRKKKNTAEVVVDEMYVRKLHQVRDKPSELTSQLDELSVKQLRKLGKLIQHPLRTKSSRHELLDELVAHFHSAEVWRKISGFR